VNHIVALVCNMEVITSRSELNDPFVRLRYGRETNGSLALHVVEFSSLHLPACVFSRFGNPDSETLANYQSFVFYQVPSSRIVVTEAVGSLDDMLNGEKTMLLNTDVLNESLQKFQSYNEEENIVKSGNEEDDVDDKADSDESY